MEWELTWVRLIGVVGQWGQRRVDLTVECREAYARLTGVELPPGPPLPSPLEPFAEGRAELDADALLRKVDEAARELERPVQHELRPSDRASDQEARVGSVES